MLRIILICYRLYRPLSYELNVADTCYIYRNSEYKSVCFRFFRRTWCERPHDGAIVPKLFGALMNCTTVYTACT